MRYSKSWTEAYLEVQEQVGVRKVDFVDGITPGLEEKMFSGKGEFEVKYASSKKGPIKVSRFNTLEDAKKFLAQVKKEGMNGIISKGGKPVKEESELDEASYNYKRAKDSKKKRLQKKGIGGMIDRAIGRVKKMQDEEVEESLALQMKMAADDIETYAKKHGGIDKKDMMKAAAMLKKGDKKGALKFIKTLDTDPRDYLLKTMGEEVEIDEESDKAMMMKLTTKAMKAMANSPQQKELIKQVNVYRKKLGMKPMKEESELDEKKSDYEDQIKAFLAKGGKIQKGDKPDQKKIDKVTKSFMKKLGVMKKKEAELDAKDKEELEKMMGEEMALDEHCGECGAMDHIDEKKGSDYELYHKTFSGAMQHAYAHAKKKGFTVDPDEIDNKVATGPKKPSAGKTNRYILGTDKKQKLHVQVANLDNKRFELNMYIEETEKEKMDIEETIRQVLEGKTKKEDSDKSEPGTQGDDKEYQKKRDEVLKKYGVKSCALIKDEKKKKECFNALDAAHVADHEEQKEDHSPAQDTVKGKKAPKDKKPLVKYEETDSPLYAQVKKLLRNK